MGQAPDSTHRPLVAHVVYRFDTGGLENGIVNLINRMPEQAYRHAIVALTEVSPAFAQRVRRADVEFIELRKPPGQGFRQFPKMRGILRTLKPAIVHTRNLAALEMQLPAKLAGVPVRIHGEHGWDVGDLDGSNRRNRLTRRLYAPLVQRWVGLSHDLVRYLHGPIGLPAERVVRICNGVDTERFAQRPAERQFVSGNPFADQALWIVGTVGRMQTVKNQTALASAFVRALELDPALRARLRLAMVGDGPLRQASQAILAAGRAEPLAWLPGERDDVADVMRAFDCFVLPSLSEGISNTMLEAMATGLPVIATAVGGNPDLVRDQVTGRLLAAGDVEGLAHCLVALANAPDRARSMGAAGRADVERHYSLPAMVAAYQHLYDRQLNSCGLALHRG